MMTREQLTTLPRGSYLTHHGVGEQGLKVLHYLGFWSERIDGMTHLMRRDFPPGGHMAVPEPSWPAGLEHQLSPVI